MPTAAQTVEELVDQAKGKIVYSMEVMRSIINYTHFKTTRYVGPIHIAGYLALIRSLPLSSSKALP